MTTRLLVLAALVAAALALAPTAQAATFTVTDGSSDAGPGTLRQAIDDANTTPGTDTIEFATSAITVTTTLDPIVDPVTVDGGGSTVVREDPAYTGPLLSFQAGSAGSTLENIELDGPGSAAGGALVQTVASNVVVSGSRLVNARTAGVSIAGTAQHVTVTSTPIYGFGTKAISFDTSGVNGGIAPPDGLRFGPRRADGTLPLTGSTASPGKLEVYRGDPSTGDSLWFSNDVGGGPFTLAAPAEPAAGETFSATVTDASGDTSEWATEAAPSDIVSPFLVVGVASTFNTVRVQPSEPVDPASVQPSDFFLNVAGVDRPVTGATVSPDGSSIVVSSSQPWLPGQAGFMHLTAPGAISDRAGNLSLGPGDVHVGGAPGDFSPPLVHRLKLLPKKMCFVARRGCRRPGGRIVFASSEDGFTWVTVFRGSRLIGTRKFLARPGDNYLRFDGKIRGRRLRPGGYKMYVGVQDTAGNLTPPARQPSAKFKVRRG